MNIRHILVSRLRFMGDIILTTPVLRNLKQAFPKAHVTFLGETPFVELLQHHPFVDEIIGLARQNSKMPVFLHLLKTRYDVAIYLFGNPRSAVLVWASGARMRIGGNFRGRRHLFTHKIQDDGKIKSAVQFHLNYLTPLRIPLKCYDTHIAVTEDERSWAFAYLQEWGYDIGLPLIAIHPGASWPAKQWLPERFAELADRLASETHAQVFFTMGPGEQELLDKVLSACTHSFPKPRFLALRQLAALLALADGFVSNDCGPMHLAPAVGTATIGILGPGTPEIWFPYREDQGHRLIHHNLDCSRCNRDFYETMECMNSISTKQVFNAILHSTQSRGISL